MARRAALIAAGRTRLRPIIMTTTAMIGGLITSTLLTLLVVPVVYTLFDDFEAWILRLWSGSGTPHS